MDLMDLLCLWIGRCILGTLCCLGLPILCIVLLFLLAVVVDWIRGR